MNITEKALDLVVDGVSMPSMLTRPSSDTSLGKIILIPGSFFNDVEGNYPHMNIFPHMYADLSKQLAAKGYDVFRFAKHGPGSGSVILDELLEPKHQHFSERIIVAKAAFNLLQENTSRNTPTFLAGHSEGSLVAYILAQDLNVYIDGVISLSGPAYRFFDLMINQAIARDKNSGKIDEMNWQQMRDTLNLARQNKPIPAEVFSNPHLAGFAFLDSVAWQYLREMDAVDPIVELKKITQPALIVQGGLDESVFIENAQKLKETRGTLNTKLVLFEKLQHFYKQVDPNLSAMESFALAGESDIGVSEAIDQWIKHL